MKAITLWQPWASLVMIGAKPLEFRKWDYRERGGAAVGERVAMHAGARPIKMPEILDLLHRLDDPICSTGLVADRARVLLHRIAAASKGRGVVELSAVLGTVRLGEPKLAEEAMPKWKGAIGDSDRLEHCKWAWPMLDVEAFAEPIPMKGWQGFWNCSIPARAA